MENLPSHSGLYNTCTAHRLRAYTYCQRSKGTLFCRSAPRRPSPQATKRSHTEEVPVYSHKPHCPSTEEGTPHEGLLAMAMYALGITPLISTVFTSGAKQVWFTDDTTSGGQLQQLKLAKNGPAFGYHPNNSTTWLMVKEENLEDAERVFADTNVHITWTGKRHLCAAIGRHTKFH